MKKRTRTKRRKLKWKIWTDDGHDYGEFEYFSKFNRINAKGIKEEIYHELLQRYGVSRSRYIKVTDFYRV